MGYFVDPVELPVKAGMAWTCCGNMSADEDPSFLTLWEGDSLRGRILDSGCDDYPVHVMMMGDDDGPYMPERIETPQERVAGRLELVLRHVKTKAVLRSDCISPLLANRHACVMLASVVPQPFGKDMPLATARRATMALVGLLDRPAWRELPEATLLVDRLGDRPLHVTVAASGISIRPAGTRRTGDMVRIRRRHYPLMGTEWEWLKASGGKGPLLRRQVDLLCGVAEILVALGGDGLPSGTRTLTLGNWLKLPRSVAVSCEPTRSLGSPPSRQGGRGSDQAAA